MVREAHVQQARPPRHRVRHAGGLLGVGAAALLESLVLHQLLGWHSVGQGSAPDPAEAAYQLAGLAALGAGVFLLHRARVRLVEPASGLVLLGSLLAAGGAFLLLEGLLLHHALGLHHVRATGSLPWDVAYLALAALALASGLRLLAVAARERGDAPARRGRALGRPP